MLFNGLKIVQKKDQCEKYMGKFPMISISLKSVDGLDLKTSSAVLTTITGKEV